MTLRRASRMEVERLTKQQCVDTYGGTIWLSGRGTVVVLSDDLPNAADGDTSILLGGLGQIPQLPDGALFEEYLPYGWLCGNNSLSCDKAGFDSNIDAIQVKGYPFRTRTWAFDLATSNGSSMVTFVSGENGNFSVDTCSKESISNSTCSDANKLVDWIRQAYPTNIQQLNDYIQANSTTKNITGIHIHSTDCSAVGTNNYVEDDYTDATDTPKGFYSLDGC